MTRTVRGAFHRRLDSPGPRSSHPRSKTNGILSGIRRTRRAREFELLRRVAERGDHAPVDRECSQEPRDTRGLELSIVSSLEKALAPLSRPRSQNFTRDLTEYRCAGPLLALAHLPPEQLLARRDGLGREVEVERQSVARRRGGGPRAASSWHQILESGLVRRDRARGVVTVVVVVVAVVVVVVEARDESLARLSREPGSFTVFSRYFQKALKRRARRRNRRPSGRRRCAFKKYFKKCLVSLARRLKRERERERDGTRLSRTRVMTCSAWLVSMCAEPEAFAASSCSRWTKSARMAARRSASARVQSLSRSTSLPTHSNSVVSSIQFGRSRAQTYSSTGHVALQNTFPSSLAQPHQSRPTLKTPNVELLTRIPVS